MVMNPTSTDLKAICEHYNKAIPNEVDFTDLPCCHVIIVIYALLKLLGPSPSLVW